MSRMSHVVQIGEIEGNIHYYIEDYAYTYLKKQEGKEKTKYFLYGEKIENEEKEPQKKLYIYGIAEKPKMEQTYFKEYYPLGFLKIKNNEKYWVTIKGQEFKVTGFYVFYAPNQAMQEYLIDHHEEEKEDKPENKIKRKPVEDGLPMKEVAMSARKYKVIRKKENLNDNLMFSFVGVAVAVMVLFLLVSTNGRKKLEIFKQVVVQTMADSIKGNDDYDIIIEEKSITEPDDVEGKSVIGLDIVDLTEESIKQQEDILPEEETVEQQEDILSEEETVERQEDILSEEETVEKQEDVSLKEENVKQNETILSKQENVYEEYVVEVGDTLAAICINKYGTLSYIQEICSINNIENADYIEPGQKIYLPR